MKDRFNSESNLGADTEFLASDAKQTDYGFAMKRFLLETASVAQELPPSIHSPIEGRPNSDSLSQEYHDTATSAQTPRNDSLSQEAHDTPVSTQALKDESQSQEDDVPTVSTKISQLEASDTNTLAASEMMKENSIKMQQLQLDSVDERQQISGKELSGRAIVKAGKELNKEKYAATIAKDLSESFAGHQECTYRMGNRMEE